MAEPDAGARGVLGRLSRPTVSLRGRILAVNLIPLMVLAGSLLFLDSYRRQLLDERFKTARIEAQITAEALAGASRERQEALLVQIGKEQRMRLRMFDAEGKLWADSFALAPPSFAFGDPVAAAMAAGPRARDGPGGRLPRRRAGAAALRRARRRQRRRLARAGACARAGPHASSSCVARPTAPR